MQKIKNMISCVGFRKDQPQPIQRNNNQRYPM